MELEKSLTEEYQQFRYLWPPEPELSFQLNAATSETPTGNNRRYSVELAQMYVRHQLTTTAVKLQQRGIRIQLSAKNLPLQITVSGKDQKAVHQIHQQLQQTEQQAYQDYLRRDYFYLLRSRSGEQFIIPDHVRVALENQASLMPVSAAFIQLYGKNNIRQIAAKLSHWIQQIPYQDLTDRKTSHGSGFSAPLRLLNEHRGDCDSKAVLFAAVLKNIFPKTAFGLIYFSDHAVIAVKMPAVKAELTVALEGGNYLIIDPTGPAPTPLGELAQRYRQALASQQYSYRLF